MKLRKIAAVLLAVLLVLGSMPVYAVEADGENEPDVLPMAADAEIVASGNCGEALPRDNILDSNMPSEVGDNVKWTFTKDGTLTIYGSGKMYDYWWDGPLATPWADYEVKNIVIESGVTSIGTDAFHDCTSIHSITIPGNVEEIGYESFKFCTALQTVTIEEGVSRIDVWAFWGCRSLTSIVIPDSVVNITESAYGSTPFVGCSSAFTIYGNPGSYAERYAQDCGFPFKSLSEFPNPNDPPEGSSQGFSAELDGWPLKNIRESFSYDEGYSIPISRYTEVYDGFVLSPLTFGLLRRQVFSKWDGSCFGMVLTSIGQYLGRLDLSSYFTHFNEEYLNQFGWEAVDDSQPLAQYYKLQKNSEAVKLIERAQISQFSEEILASRMFDRDKGYSGLLDYLFGDSPDPLLIGLNYSSSEPDSSFLHAVATDTTSKPVREAPEGIEDSAGWYRIPIYDPNSPSSNGGLTYPNYYYKGESKLYVNEETGEWCYTIRGGASPKIEKYSSPYYRNIVQTISFYDIEQLDEKCFNYNEPLHFPYQAGALECFFSAKDVTLKSPLGSVLFEVNDNEVTELSANCQFVPKFDGDTNVLSGFLILPQNVSELILEASSADVSLCNADYLTSFSISSNTDAKIVYQAGKITVTPTSQADVSLAMQANTTDGEYEALALEGTLESGVALTLTHEDGKLKASTENKTTKMDVSVDSSSLDGLKTYENVLIDNIETGENETLVTPEAPTTPTPRPTFPTGTAVPHPTWTPGTPDSGNGQSANGNPLGTQTGPENAGVTAGLVVFAGVLLGAAALHRKKHR